MLNRIQLSDNASIINTSSLVLIIILICLIMIVLFLEERFKRLNNYLFHREELFYSLCSNINDIFVIYNTIKHKLDYISPNFENTFELNIKSVIKDPTIICDLVPSEIKEKINKVLYSSDITQMLQLDFEIIKPKSNESCWVALKIYPIFNNHQVSRLIFSAYDITKEKKANIELKAALMNVRKANEAKKEFLSHMSHELKTPINAIIGMTQIALYDKSKAETCLNNINVASKKLLTIINNILDMSRIDSDKLELSYEPFYMNELLSPFIDIMSSQAEIKNQHFLYINDSKEQCLIGDSLRLIQILENCISNAIKFTPLGGFIRFEVTELVKSEEKRVFRFIITDTGKGMSDEFLKNLFKPFQQESSSIYKTYGGTGLGLSITNKLVNLMGGSIKVASKLHNGTSITIDIPFKLSPDMPEANDNDSIFSISDEYNCQGKRVLVVEDNEISMEIICEFLKYLNVKVSTASNGYEAIKLFEEAPQGYYNMILMDLHMPDLDGYETTKAIRSSKHPNAKTIYIAVMTADDYYDELQGNIVGINKCIIKPIDASTFYSLMNDIRDRNINSDIEDNDIRKGGCEHD